ncbi:MAG TPA: DUF459 domain-containing protein [Gaiellaceae bacterium]|jgi:hypothetical protein|nr:DUF459 domain-containing protein [Gaiellaceae bacterium]
MLPAYKGIFVLAFALLFAALLQAEGLRKQAQIQPAGFQRDLALHVTKPLVSFSRALHLTTPRHDLQVAIGREHEDDIDTRVHLTLPPPAGPIPRKPPKKHGRPVVAKPEPKPLFTSARPLRVWVAGDSLAQIPGDALERVGGAVDVVGVESRLSTGLARTDLYNWFSRIQQVPRLLHPDVAVFSFGADDAHDYMGGAHVGPFGSPSWVAEYRRRVDGVTRELNAQGVYVVWLGLPIPDGPGFKKSFPVVNRILESVAKAHAKQSAYVDTWHLLDDFHGRYTAYLRVHGKLTLMRLPDGVHYTQAAGDLIVAQLVKQLRDVYRLRT